MEDVQFAINHLKNHQKKWPATYEELIKCCMELEDFKTVDKKEFMDNLPKKIYNSAEEVIAAMGWKTPAKPTGF